jgi:predicted ATP-grasp superfamily ATP-dependent carboligase
LVLDSRAVLATCVCRSLKSIGWTADLLAQKGSPAFRGRLKGARLHAPPLSDARAFRDFVRTAVERGRYGAIFVCCETVLELIQPLLLNSSAWGALLTPSADALRIAFSKNASVQLAEHIGIHAPRTVIPDSTAEIAAIAESFSFPVVVKGDKGDSSSNVRFVWNRTDLANAYCEIKSRESKYNGAPSIQEFIPGEQYSIGGLFFDGKPLRVCAYRKLFTYPVNGGGLTVKCVTERPEELLEAAFALFARLRYTGLGQAQFIRDARDGHFKFMEINPRVWASIGVAECAGVDVYTPYTQLAAGMSVAPDLNYRTGVQYHRFSMGVHYVAQKPSYAPRFVKDCLDPRVRSDFRWSDPGPHIPTLRDLVRLFRRQ